MVNVKKKFLQGFNEAAMFFLPKFVKNGFWAVAETFLIRNEKK
jgi:hypothetical protein